MLYIPLGQIVLTAPGGSSLDSHGPACLEALEHGAAYVGIQPRLIGDLSGGCRFPQLRQRQVNATLLRGQRLQVTPEVFGVVVNQVEQVVHQLTEGPAGAEAGDNGQQPGIPSRQNLQGPDSPRIGGLP